MHLQGNLYKVQNIKFFGAGKIFHVSPDGQGKYFNPEGAGTASPNFKPLKASVPKVIQPCNPQMIGQGITSRLLS